MFAMALFVINRTQSMSRLNNMNQTKKDSLLESLTNILIGLSITLTANAILFPMFGWSISAGQNLSLGLCYTLISLARSYFIRRIFNGRSVYQAIKGLFYA